MDNFSELLKVQRETLSETKSIKTLLESGNLKHVQEAAAQYQLDQIAMAKENKSYRLEEENIKIQREIRDNLANQLRMAPEYVDALNDMAQGIRTFKTIGDHFRDFKDRIKEKFGQGGLGIEMLKKINTFGTLNKTIAKKEFIKEQRELGSTKSNAELKEDFDKRNRVAIDLQYNQKEIDKLKSKFPKLSEKQIRNTPAGEKLFGEREALVRNLGTVDKQAALLTDITPKSETTKINEEQNDTESEIENAKKMEEQTDLLEKIAENTSPLNDKASQATPSTQSGDESTGGILSGIGKGFAGLGKGLAALGKGAGAGIKGLLIGLSQGIIALGTAVASGVGAIGLAALAGIILTIAGAMRIAAPAIKAFAPVLMKIAEVIGDVVIGAIQALPAIFTSVGDIIIGVIRAITDGITGVIDAVVTSVERLAKVDGSGLFKLAAGLLAVSGALAVFAGANVVAGIGNFVGKLLNFGGDSPVDQVIKLGKYGAGVQQAASGLEDLGVSMKAFADLPKDAMDAVNDFPWLKATLFAKAGGKMQVENASVQKVEPGVTVAAATPTAANDVMFASAENKEFNRRYTAAPSTNTVVNSPTTISKQTSNNIMATPVRNHLLGTYYTSKNKSAWALPYAL